MMDRNRNNLYHSIQFDEKTRMTYKISGSDQTFWVKPWHFRILIFFISAKHGFIYYEWPKAKQKDLSRAKSILLAAAPLHPHLHVWQWLSFHHKVQPPPTTVRQIDQFRLTLSDFWGSLIRLIFDQLFLVHPNAYQRLIISELV